MENERGGSWKEGHTGLVEASRNGPNWRPAIPGAVRLTECAAGDHLLTSAATRILPPRRFQINQGGARRGIEWRPRRR